MGYCDYIGLFFYFCKLFINRVISNCQNYPHKYTAKKRVFLCEGSHIINDKSNPKDVDGKLLFVGIITQTFQSERNVEDGGSGDPAGVNRKSYFKIGIEHQSNA